MIVAVARDGAANEAVHGGGYATLVLESCWDDIIDTVL